VIVRTPTLRLGLIGAGIQRSRTPAMHEQEAAAHGWSCRYEMLDLDTIPGGAAALPSLVDAAEHDGFAGLNITHPCKESVLPLLDTLSDDARKIGAVNTIVFTGSARVGWNTDWWGFRESVTHGLQGAPLDRVVQLGAGGAGAATAYAALQMGVARLDIFDAIGTRAEALADRMNTHFPGRAVAVGDVAEVLAHADGLIHATPTGMASHPGLPIAANLIDRRLWVAEVVYLPLETELLRAARARGCRTLDGSGMAVSQAVEAFRLFTGTPADPDRMRRFFGAATIS
jgi:quinate/shikimate dehydrogenase (NAD+)